MGYEQGGVRIMYPIKHTKTGGITFGLGEEARKKLEGIVWTPLLRNWKMSGKTPLKNSLNEKMIG